MGLIKKVVKLETKVPTQTLFFCLNSIYIEIFQIKLLIQINLGPQQVNITEKLRK